MLKLKKVHHGVIWIVILFVCILALGNIVPRFFGIHPYIVLSGSMEPFLPTGSIVYINKKTAPENIHAGDIISYQQADILITHRIIEETRTFVITKGDANEQADFLPVSRDSISGKYVFHIPYLGYICALLTKPVFYLIILSLMMIQPILSFLISYLTKESSHQNNRKESSL